MTNVNNKKCNDKCSCTQTKVNNKTTFEETNRNHNNIKDASYSYYSKLLKEPFDSINELKEAEEAYYAKLRAKEDKATQKKLDAQAVEEAFKALNNARKIYKEAVTKLTDKYTQDLRTLKETFETDRKEIQNLLVQAEDAYAGTLKAFTEKYPEGFHLTLKDGDFETTLSGNSIKSANYDNALKLFDWLFNI